MTGKLSGVAIERAGTLYGVPTVEEQYSDARLASNAVDGLLRLLGNDTYFKFQSKAFELSRGARLVDEIPLSAIVEALKYACDPKSEQVKELHSLPEDESGPVYR
jgi:hypothetical protein